MGVLKALVLFLRICFVTSIHLTVEILADDKKMCDRKMLCAVTHVFVQHFSVVLPEEKSDKAIFGRIQLFIGPHGCLAFL